MSNAIPSQLRIYRIESIRGSSLANSDFLLNPIPGAQREVILKMGKSISTHQAESGPKRK